MATIVSRGGKGNARPASRGGGKKTPYSKGLVKNFLRGKGPKGGGTGG